jgi:hypothetical protein
VNSRDYPASPASYRQSSIGDSPGVRASKAHDFSHHIFATPDSRHHRLTIGNFVMRVRRAALQTVVLHTRNLSRHHHAQPPPPLRPLSFFFQQVGAVGRAASRLPKLPRIFSR